MALYNIGIWLMALGFRILGLFNRKARTGLKGRKHIFERLGAEISPDERIVWIHCASLGEFEQGRPLIETIKAKQPGYKVLLTFFSPSGYEIRKNYPGADHIFYLPIDTPRNARRFIAVVRPEIAVFVKYEFWLNYLRRLRMAGCPTFIVSAIFRRDSVFFKPYGGMFRNALRGFERLFVQDETSKELLAQIGISSVSVTGDTRFDRVAEVRRNAVAIPAVAAFAEGHMTLVAGSTWPPDEQLLVELAQNHPKLRLVIAPHETGEERVAKLAASFQGCITVRYTQLDREKVTDKTQVMIIDTIGILSSVYAYGNLAYIGGGFGVGIHNTLEAAVYGVPISFGPNYAKFLEARELIEIGAAKSISNPEEFEQWFTSMVKNPAELSETGKRAAQYVSSHTGATEIIMKALFK